MGDRIAILDGGELQQIGTPNECYKEPNNQFVAGFIGSPSMNFFDVELSDGRLVHDAFSTSVSPAIQERLAGEGSEFVMGIRPEEVLSEDDAVGDDDAFEIEVNVVEPLGDVTYIYTDIGGTESTISVSRNTELQPGERIQAAFPDSEIHVFDQHTGEAIVSRGEPVDDGVAVSETGRSDASEA